MFTQIRCDWAHVWMVGVVAHTGPEGMNSEGGKS
jgi:hypothetical protein